MAEKLRMLADSKRPINVPSVKVDMRIWPKCRILLTEHEWKVRAYAIRLAKYITVLFISVRLKKKFSTSCDAFEHEPFPSSTHFYCFLQIIRECFVFNHKWMEVQHLKEKPHKHMISSCWTYANSSIYWELAMCLHSPRSLEMTNTSKCNYCGK